MSVEAPTAPPLRAEAPVRAGGAWELEVVTDAAGVERLLPEWRQLAREAARSPFESPEWVVAWWGNYGPPARPRLLAWRSGDDLVAVLPLGLSLSRRLTLAFRELSIWTGSGMLLGGGVDLLARDEHRDQAFQALVDWLRSSRRWDALHFLRLPVGSPTADALRAASREAGWRYVSMTDAVRSRPYMIDLPEDPTQWQGQMHAKERQNMRRQVRLFGRHRNGVIERVEDAARGGELVEHLARLMRERWGEEEIYFGRDGRFASFSSEAVTGGLANGTAYAFVARDDLGVQACLVNLILNRRAAAIMVGVTQDPDYRRFSLGKNLFDASINEAVARDCRSYDFLWVGDYKASYWHAVPHVLESGLVTRGPAGTALAGYVAMRRVVLPRALRAVRRRQAG